MPTTKTIYLFHGEDSYSAVTKTKLWQKAFEEKYGSINTEEFEGANLTAPMFAESVSTLPFLSEKKLVIIHNLFKEGKTEELKSISQKLELIDQNCIVIFTERQKADARTSLFKNIKKIGEIKEFKLLNPPQLTSWITQEAKKQNIQLPYQQIKLLAEIEGPNLWQQKQEINKIGLYAQGNQITNDELTNIISPNIQSTIFRLTDNVGIKNTKKSISTLSELLDNGENIIQILFMLARHFRILIQIKNCIDKGMQQNAITKTLKLHPFVVSNSMNQVRNFTNSQLIQIHKAILEIDIASKTGKIKISTSDSSEMRLAIEKLIISTTLKI